MAAPYDVISLRRYYPYQVKGFGNCHLSLPYVGSTPDSMRFKCSSRNAPIIAQCGSFVKRIFQKKSELGEKTALSRLPFWEILP